MSRSMWKGAISFGLVNIPVELYTAIERREPAFHMLNKEGTCRLRRKLYCPETGEEYEYRDTAKGYEIAPDQYVLVQPEELEQLKPAGGRSIDIQQFVEFDEIDSIYFNHSYYVAPGEHGAKGYALLAEAMKRSHRVGIAKFVMRNSEYLAALRVADGRTIILETMYYAEDIRPAENIGIPSDAKVDQKELKLAQQLIESLHAKFAPEAFKNEYRERVEELLRRKSEGKEIVLPEAKRPETGKIVDLMEMLKRSVEKEKAPPGGRKRGGARSGRGKKSGRREVA